MTTPDPSVDYNGTLYAQPPTPKESSSVYTDKTANTAGKNDQPVREFLLRFEYLQKGKQPVPIISHHRQLLTSILNAHKDQVTVYDKNNKPVDQSRINSITSIAHLRDLVDINTRTGDKVRHILIMKLRTSLSVYELRTSTGVMRQLQTMEAYIQEHFFGITEWDIASLGWFRELHPNHMSYDMIIDHCNGLITGILKDNFPPKTRIPFYKLSNCSPKFQLEGQDEMRTKAIQINCERQYSRQLHKMFVKALETNPIYVPWNARRKDPTWYKNSMRAQFKYLCNTWTLPVSGVTRKEMWYFETTIKATGLVASVHPHRHTDTAGRWNLLVHKDNMKAARTAVQGILDKWETYLPDDPNVRATWGLTRRVGTDRSALGGDISSDGDQTYATASMASLSTILTAEDHDMKVTTTSPNYFDLTIVVESDNREPAKSYLEAVTSSHTAPQPSAKEIQMQLEINRLRSEAESAKADAANMKAELASLKSMILGKSHDTSADSSNDTLPSTVVEPTSTTSTSTLTTADLLHRQTQFENTITETIATQMNAMFQQLLDKIVDPITPITNEKKHQASDASSPVKQSDSKRQDVKATPPPKNHPVAGVTTLQNP
jgi:hypothetical protein